MSLVLDSLEIKNFRAFKHLRIEKLGRVNLIVGKNNVGKSSVLEALWVYAEKGEPEVVFQLLRERDEWSKSNRSSSVTSSIDDRVLALRHLFFGRGELDYNQEPITIGQLLDTHLVKIWITPSEWVDTGYGQEKLRMEEPDNKVTSSNLLPSLSVNIGGATVSHFPLDKDFTTKFFRDRKNSGQIHSVVIAYDGLTAKDVAAYWDNTVLSDLQYDVVAALQIIAPGTVSINFVGDRNGGRERIPIVKTQDFALPIPLRSMGEGMSRMLGIALALVNAKDGMLLIDEVDTGLHYSVLPDFGNLFLRSRTG